jgi:hypothetical protein
MVRSFISGVAEIPKIGGDVHHSMRYFIPRSVRGNPFEIFLHGLFEINGRHRAPKSFGV